MNLSHVSHSLTLSEIAFNIKIINRNSAWMGNSTCKKQKFGVNSSFKSVTIGFLWY